MVPSDARLTVLEHIVIFTSMHAVTNVMADLRLQFQRETAKDIQFVMLQESGLFQLPEMTTDRSEFPVEMVQTSVSLQFSTNIRSSQFAPPSAGRLGLRSVTPSPGAACG